MVIGGGGGLVGLTGLIANRDTKRQPVGDQDDAQEMNNGAHSRIGESVGRDELDFNVNSVPLTMTEELAVSCR